MVPRLPESVARDLSGHHAESPLGLSESKISPPLLEPLPEQEGSPPHGWVEWEVAPSLVYHLRVGCTRLSLLLSAPFEMSTAGSTLLAEAPPGRLPGYTITISFYR